MLHLRSYLSHIYSPLLEIRHPKFFQGAGRLAIKLSNRPIFRVLFQDRFGLEVCAGYFEDQQTSGKP